MTNDTSNILRVVAINESTELSEGGGVVLGEVETGYFILRILKIGNVSVMLTSRAEILVDHLLLGKKPVGSNSMTDHTLAERLVEVTF
jgi:hypothetical protein